MSVATTRKRSAHLSVKLDTDEKADLEMIAQGQSRSVHYVMCKAVREYIQQEKERIAFYDRGVQAGEHFNQTGLHTTLEEMQEWAKARKTSKSLPLPKCHV